MATTTATATDLGSSCPGTPTPPSASAPLGSDRRARHEKVTAALDDAAALINTVHATALSSVIEALNWKLGRDFDGFAGPKAWLVAKFDFHNRTAADIAAIAQRSRKFAVLTESALSQTARIDQVAYAVRSLDRTPAMRLYARTPYREPVPSPFDPEMLCTTPETLVAQYCAHAPYADLRAHLAELEASLAESAELFEGLGEQSLQHLDLWEQDNGMWGLNGQLSADTGALFAKLLTTSVPPPRQDETDTEGDLPPQANRNAEALHQMLASYGASGDAPTRHGHTATLNLVVDIETLQGKDTGRLPLLEGRPISVARARLLACEAVIIPGVFDYATGEAVELGRAFRLPTAALRRKLELEQQGGCAWHGCQAPVEWTEAHHLIHWANGGETVAENLILLCRFHHGRIHTPGWNVTKTGPGQALIVHHDHDAAITADMAEYDTDGCGCADHRSSEDLEADFRDGLEDDFPTGLYPEEQTGIGNRDLKDTLDAYAMTQAKQAVDRAKAKLRERFTTPAEVLGRPDGRPSGERTPHSAQARIPKRDRAPQHVQALIPQY
ncbi:HNH endonuclease signature motif containing protein [Glycomyces buryatensis]|uniref:DUF222 domain-containing protein n=1 Tax=Glycomyces buryatensis TaxID=2570927 RepID=A0A4S8Q3F0_9ACTN|nr:HNH endonuclease signature motif containing protein [Glycomyces buryatensis]THV38648.1 DUF222 domain-containing protein [Glycomyces buryatensis]